MHHPNGLSSYALWLSPETNFSELRVCELPRLILICSCGRLADDLRTTSANVRTPSPARKPEKTADTRSADTFTYLTPKKGRQP